VTVRVALTGTPGTGKTTASDRLESSVIHLNEAVREANLWSERDAERDSLVVDETAVAEWLGDWDGILESHLAHRFDADLVVVLRCRPDVLETRLLERGEPPAKARENAESEALDVILSEAVERYGTERVHEIDTTDRTPAEVATEIRAAVDGERDPDPGRLDFIEYL
jgi:adenylate kinase